MALLVHLNQVKGPNVQKLLEARSQTVDEINARSVGGPSCASSCCGLPGSASSGRARPQIFCHLGLIGSSSSGMASNRGHFRASDVSLRCSRVMKNEQQWKG